VKHAIILALNSLADSISSTPDHKFELDDTLLLYKILLFRAMPEEDPQQDVAEADLPDDDQQDHEDHDHVPEGNLNEDQIL